MRAPLSIVIPTLNAVPALERALPVLTEGVALGLVRELILSDGGSTDPIADLAHGAGARLVTGPPGRGGQLRRGAAAAEGDWLLFLHADTLLPEGWSAPVADAFRDRDKARYFDLAFDADGMGSSCVSAWANLRSRVLGLPYGDQGLLISRNLYDRVGGFDDIPLMEDVALARALRGRLVPLGARATTSADRYLTEGWVARGARNLMLLSRYLAGADPEKLARAYRRPRTD